MVKKILVHLWSWRREFFKYFTIGVSALLLDLATLYLFKSYFHWSATLSVVVNQLIIINYVFFLNKYWSFRAAGITHQQMVRFCILALFNYSISIAWMAVFNGWWHFNYLVVRVANVALAVGWNFLLYKYWVFRPVPPPAPPHPNALNAHIQSFPLCTKGFRDRGCCQSEK